MVGEGYTLVADPMERPLPDGPVVCTGDLLHLAPPPSADPTGSVVDLVAPGVRRAYERGDPGGVLDAVRAVAGTSTVERIARGRYDDLFAAADELYYVAGNQDLPGTLAAAAADHDGVAHASALPGVAGVDGIVPRAAGTPPGAFPCECSLDQFRSAVAGATDDVLVAHTLPDGFDPAAHGFELAVCSTDRSAPPRETDGVVRLPSYRLTGTTGRLSRSERGALTVSVGDRSTAGTETDTHAR